MGEIKASYKTILDSLLKEECNKHCADCGAPGALLIPALFSRPTMGFCNARSVYLHSMLGSSPKLGRAHFFCPIRFIG